MKKKTLELNNKMIEEKKQLENSIFNLKLFNFNVKNIIIGTSLVTLTYILFRSGHSINISNEFLISQNNLESLKIKKEILILKLQNPIEINTQTIIRPTKFMIEKIVTKKYLQE